MSFVHLNPHMSNGNVRKWVCPSGVPMWYASSRDWIRYQHSVSIIRCFCGQSSVLQSAALRRSPQVRMSMHW